LWAVPNPEDLAKSFLLGRSTAEARDKFEERLFSDDDQFFETLTAEHDLTDQFHRRGLAPADDKDFRAHLLNPELAHRVIVSQSLDTSSVPLRRGWLAPVTSGRTAASIAAAGGLAAAAILAVSLGVVQVLKTSKLAPPSAPSQRVITVPEPPTPGSLLVGTDLSRTRVFVDGVDHGEAPAGISDLKPGEHELVLLAPGRPPHRERVVIKAGETVTKTITLGSLERATAR
jgi:hypothetical protein